MGALLVDRFYERPSAALIREVRAVEGVLNSDHDEPDPDPDGDWTDLAS
jgi:hypothetical protein